MVAPRLSFAIAALLLHVSLTAALHKDAFTSDVWQQRPTHEQSADAKEQFVHFTIALAGRNIEQMKQEFLEVSQPKSPTYGAYRTAPQLHTSYGSRDDDKVCF
jgi:subtilase family serine protease